MEFDTAIVSLVVKKDLEVTSADIFRGKSIYHDASNLQLSQLHIIASNK